MIVTIDQIANKIAPLLREFGITRAAIFGSRAKGTAMVDSDLDLLVEMKEPLGLFRFAQLNYRLEDVLDMKVDLVKRSALKPAFAKKIIHDLHYIYG